MTEKVFGKLATGSLSKEVQCNPNQSVLDEVISSGKLGIISNNQLKFALSSWSGLMLEVRLQEEELHRTRFNTIDIVRNEGNLRRAIHGPGLESLGMKQCKFKAGNLHLLNSLSFEGHMMDFITMSISINTHEYQSIGHQIDILLLIISEKVQ